jgi:hypothetical protein
MNVINKHTWECNADLLYVETASRGSYQCDVKLLQCTHHDQSSSHLSPEMDRLVCWVQFLSVKSSQSLEWAHNELCQNFRIYFTSEILKRILTILYDKGLY